MRKHLCKGKASEGRKRNNVIDKAIITYAKTT